MYTTTFKVLHYAYLHCSRFQGNQFVSASQDVMMHVHGYLLLDSSYT